MTKAIFPPDTESQAELNQLADNMVNEATSIDNPKILSVTGFTRDNISIMHQQIRATNLAWALGWTRRVKPGDTVAIVGGSFSGLTLAVILALVNDAIVLVFEKESELFARFRDKGHRHLSTNLNSRALGKNFDPSWSAPEFRSPIFAWPAGRASDVAAFWTAEYINIYDDILPIFISRQSEVRREMISDSPKGLQIDFSVDNVHRGAIPVDLVIDATGFGDEGNPREVADFSYWEAGHRLIYDHLVTPASVLISGCGDSGVIEAMHYAIRDFRHGNIEAMWPLGVGFDAMIDKGLVRARLDAVFQRDDIDQFDQPVLSEICWWLEQRSFIELNPTVPWPPGGESWVRPMYDAIESALAPHYAAIGPDCDIALVDYHALEKFVELLPFDVQIEVRAATRRLGDECISNEIHDLAESIPLPPNLSSIHGLARSDVEIILNGRTTTPYSRQLSPFNVWLMRLLLSFPSVRYFKGEIATTTQRADRRFESVFEDGTSMTSDRVVTRYGPAPRDGLAIGRRRDTQVGDWLLTSPRYLSRDPAVPNQGRYINPARENVATALDGLSQRTSASPKVSKKLIIQRIMHGPNSTPSGDPIYTDPLPWLATELRSGRHPSFVSDSNLARMLARR